MLLAQLGLFLGGMVYGTIALRDHLLALIGFYVMCGLVGLAGAGLGLLAAYVENRKRESLYERIGWDKSFREKYSLELKE